MNGSANVLDPITSSKLVLASSVSVQLLQADTFRVGSGELRRLAGHTPIKGYKVCRHGLISGHVQGACGDMLVFAAPDRAESDQPPSIRRQ